MKREYTPKSVGADGNCLYRAVSRSLFGHEDFHALLRLLAAMEMIRNRKFYDEDHKDFVDLVNDVCVVCGPYQQALREVCRDGEYSSVLHILAVSAALALQSELAFPRRMTCTKLLSTI